MWWRKNSGNKWNRWDNWSLYRSVVSHDGFTISGSQKPIITVVRHPRGAMIYQNRWRSHSELQQLIVGTTGIPIQWKGSYPKRKEPRRMLTLKPESGDLLVSYLELTYS